MTFNQKRNSFFVFAALFVAGAFFWAWLANDVERQDERVGLPTEPPTLYTNEGVMKFGEIPVEPTKVPFYYNGGYVPNRADTEKFIRSLPHGEKTLRQVAPHLFNDEKDAVLLYRALYEVYEKKYGTKWTVGKQGIGDCVSWGWAHSADIRSAVDWKLGLAGDWKLVATESIYGGSRVEARGRTTGGWSDGSYGGAAAKWFKDWGIIYRQNYTELNIDLTTYSSSRAKDWGNYGNGGKDDNGKLDEIAKKHPVKTVAVVINFEEAAAAIKNGYPIPVCSGQGFSSNRDSDGFSKAQGSWAHCMCFIGVRYSPRPGLLCLNSWGPNWVKGGKWPEDMPEGSFWVEADVATRMLSGRDSFAVSDIVGFPARKLRNKDGW